MSTHKRRRLLTSSENEEVLQSSSSQQPELQSRPADLPTSPSTQVTTVKLISPPSTPVKPAAKVTLHKPKKFKITHPRRIVLSDYLPTYLSSGAGKARAWYWHEVPPENSEESVHLIAYNLITREDVRVEDLRLPKPVADLTSNEAQVILATYMNETSRMIDVPITYPRIRASGSAWGLAWRKRMASKRK